ncbi:MAG: two-component system sensor histidine kinase NtrB [Phycisphaerae bacterium]
MPVGPDFYEAAVLNAGIPVVSLDATGRIIAWNSAAVRMFGRSEGEVLGLPLETLIPSEYRAVASRAFQRTIQQRSTNVYELSMVPQGGKNPIHVGVTLSCVNDSASSASGQLAGVMAWMRDISNRKELESHLTRTRHMASVGTLAAGVAHHFNNIACGMGTMVEFALATEDPGAMLKALRMSAEACSRISYITQSLLACSGETGMGQSECGCADQCDLTEELLRFADAVEPTLNEKGIALDLDLQARRVSAVPRLRFGQALQHLLHNAEDAIADRAAKNPGAEKRITIRTQSQGDQIMIQFGDTGVGIDPDDVPQIFDPFFTKKGVQGGGNRNNPGLGLTLVHSVIMDMGGHIWADSTPNKGTTIHLLIPVTV